MAYHWTAEMQPGFDLADDELSALGIGKSFSDQAAAELWLSESFAELLDAGLSNVSLYEEDRLIYGPMGLAAE